MPNKLTPAASVDARVQSDGQSLRSVVKKAVNEAVVENAALTVEHGHPGHGVTPHGSRLAVLSAPLITTLVDATGLIIYFTIAKIILQL